VSLRSVVSPTDMRRVCASFPTGVTVVAGLVNARPAGMAASSFTSVSLDPPIVSVCVGNTSSTAALLVGQPYWGVSVLAAHQGDTARVFGSRGDDRFRGSDWRALTDGGVLIDGASAWLNCRVDRLVPAGDHTIALLAVVELEADHDLEPLVFHASTYRRLALDRD
jgi:flavin reductase (DIM6/NTAB) family NADH-FMN oxidoreductase RutF